MEDTDDDIAVVGIGCNFPGGEGLDSFWKVLLEGKNCVVDVPSKRFDTTFWYDANDSKPGKTQTTKAALINGFNEFDHKFFGITEAEADFMDPQQKLLLECTYRAVEDAGIPMECMSGSRAGVYIGLMNRDYEMLSSNNPATITHYHGTGTAMSIAANRISFSFNLTGPSLAVDSACSSSLVALHLACQAIKQGDCQMALCGGVNCIIEPRVFVALSKAKMISPEGTSKPFSSKADGYGRGEGCGVVLLKPLKNAIQDCNKIWGIISKTAVNQDGRSVTPITKPSVVQQEELLRQIYSETNLNVQYIEAHGTGTQVGDATEAESISNIIGKARPPGSEIVWIGSVKGNIGHTESAAGVAGLIKVLLMMKHETIVPSVFNAEVGLIADVKTLRIPTRAERWQTNGSLKRVAGINSFGFGGTNAHAVVKEYRQATAPIQIQDGGPKLFVTSAASERSLILSITDTQQRLCSDPTVDLQALSYTSACGRSHNKHKYRKTVFMSSLLDLQQQLISLSKAKTEPTKPHIEMVFVFSGNGVAYRGMCKHLFREVPVFKDKVREVESLFQKHGTMSQWFAADCDNEDFSQPDVVQPLLFAIQVGIATLLKHWGVRPDAVLGHSVGEVAAAHCSGLLSLEDAVKVVHHRSTLQKKVAVGKMLVVGNVTIEKVLKVLRDFSGKICVAAFNSPQSCTLSGDADAIDVLSDKLKMMFADIFLHVLDAPAAYHSHVMDPIVESTERSIASLVVNDMECELFSTVTGDRYSDGDFSTGKYWAKNIREAVLFEQALRAATKDKQPSKNMVFVEIGPRRALQRNILETLGDDVVVLSSVQPMKDYETLFCTVAKLFELGINVHWQELYRGCKTIPIPLPVYHFDNTKREFNFEDIRKGNKLSFLPCLLESQIMQDTKEYNLSMESVPYLWEHKNNGVSILPGTFYVELAYASVTAHLKLKKSVSSLQLRVAFQSLFTLSSNSHRLKVTLEHAKNEGNFQICSSAAMHASGSYVCSEQEPFLEESTICVDAITKRCTLIMKQTEIYSILSQAGFEYGSIFRQLDDVHFGAELKEAVTVIQVPVELKKNIHDCFIHPVLLDYFLQMTAVVAMGHCAAKQGFPSGIGSVVISGSLREEMVMYLRATEETSEFLDVCGCFSTTEGKVLVELRGVRITFLDSNIPQSVFFHNEVIPIPDKADLNQKIKALLFEDKLGIGEALRPYMHPESITVVNREHWMSNELQDLALQSLNTNLRDVLFIWGVEDLSHLSCERMLGCLVTCCETFRQVVLASKDSKHSFTVRVITYRATEVAVDRISPGFVLAGMTRACAAEMAGLFFQMIDLNSVTNEDIITLVHVINTCRQQEVIVRNGQASAIRIVQTPIMDTKSFRADKDSAQDFVLQTTNPFNMASLSATPYETNENLVQEGSVEVQLTRVCVHSSDYFPVSLSHLNFGKTLYWNQHTSDKHKLLALDFSGIVTAVGKDVYSLCVGDHIASCYPVAASQKIRIPDAVCYNTKRLPFLKENPCMSYFVLSWEILQRRLYGVKQHQKKLAIITPNSASTLVKVLALTAIRSGWNVSCLPHFRKEPLTSHPCQALVFLPPFDHTWQEIDDDHERQVIFVCSVYMPSSLPANIFGSKSELTYVHKLDVTHVLQRANLKAQNRNIFNWLMSLGFDTESLPLKSETFQVSNAAEPQNESYFTAKTVQQVLLKHSDFNCPLSDILFISRPEQLFKRSCVYIVTGGLTGLGFETVKFITHNGGGCIVTLSRRTLTDEKQCEIELLQKRYGVVIMNIKCDVSVSRQVDEAITKTEQRFSPRPIRGVFHSAAVLQDALIENLDESLFQKVLQPKVSGALNLHRVTLNKKLDFFVCYSSISSFIGNASQCNYAAANSFLDMFCHYRRNLGLAAQSINWGPLNLGLLLNKHHFQKFLEAKGIMIMNVCEVHEALKKCLLMNRPQQVICKFNFRNLNIHVLSQNASLRERLSALVELQLKDCIRNDLTVPPLPSTHDCVRTLVSDVSNVSVDELDDDTSLSALGIDSMLAMTLQNKIFQETGVNIPLVRILDPNSTLATLANFVTNN
ncbi:mycocerosic acid synthase-like polyketide synthase [Aulostomus maculatus]